jgi:mannose-6-phosphate isomerase-like protein (cupin superfamily)
MDSYLKTLHQGTFHPQSGIKHCFHDHCEERFFIFEGEAQFRYCRPERAA